MIHIPDLARELGIDLPVELFDEIIITRFRILPIFFPAENIPPSGFREEFCGQWRMRKHLNLM